MGKGRFVFQQALGLGSLYKLFAISEEKKLVWVCNAILDMYLSD